MPGLLTRMEMRSYRHGLGLCDSLAWKQKRGRELIPAADRDRVKQIMQRQGGVLLLFA